MASEREIEAAAEALARLPLTEKGKCECRWPNDWSRDEQKMYREEASAALTAAEQSRAVNHQSSTSARDAALALSGTPLFREKEGLRAALIPFASLGGIKDGICTAFHGLPADTVIYENSGEIITPQKVWRARAALSFGTSQTAWPWPPTSGESK